MTLAAESAATPAPAPRPWLALAVAAGLLVAQVALLDRLVGEALFGISEALFGRRFLRKEVLVAMLAACAVVHPHIRRQLDAYRLAPMTPSRLGWQALAFGGLFAWLAGLSAGLPQRVIGELPTQLVAAALAAVWLASIALLLPPGTAAGRVVAGGLFAATVTAAGIGIADWGMEPFWTATGGFTTRLVEAMLTPFAGAPVIRPSRFDIGTRDFVVHIGGGCGGWHGILLITTLFAGALWWFRRRLRFPRALILFPVGITLIYLANAVRITALILVGIWISPTIAVDGFHSQAGWVAFLVVGLGLLWTASRMPFFAADDGWAHDLPAAAGATARGSHAVGTGDWPAAHGPSVSACLLPFLALLATTIATGLFSAHGVLDILYPVRVVVVAAVLWGLRRSFDIRWRDAIPSPAALGLGALVFVIWILLVPTPLDPDAAARHDPARLGPLWGPVWLAFRVIGYTVTVPIAEELAFRGYLARRLVNEDVEAVPPGTFSWPSFLVSSLAFGALHQANWMPGTLAGMAFAVALYHRRRLGDAIVAHATTNALLTVTVIATGAWASWG